MSYTIYNTDGTTLLLLADNTVDQSATSLNLVGKNVNGYGQYVNNNFIKLLGNSASAAGSPPRSPLTGQLWFDTTARRLKVYDGSFKPVTGASVSGSAPVNPVSGDLWFDSINYQLNAYNGSVWTIVGPPFQARVGENGWIVPSGSFLDTYQNRQLVTLMKNYGRTLGIISTASFTTTEFTTSTTLLSTSTTDIVNGLTVFGSIQATGNMKVYNTLTTKLLLSTNIINSGTLTTIDLDTRTMLASSTATFTKTTNSTSTTTGALIISGGVGIGKDLYVGGKIVAQELDIQYTTVTTTLIITDDVISTYNTTPAYSTNTGALVIGGGIGVNGGVFVGAALTATTVVATHSTTTNAVISKLTATNVLVTTITATNSLVTNFTATNSTLTNVVIGAALNMGTNKITNMADPVADTDAVTRQFLYGRSIVLSMDVSDGISNANIITYLAQIAPVAEYKNGTNARILCSTITLSSGTVSVSTTNGTFLITTSTSGTALTGATASATAPTVSVSRVVKTFTISSGAWTFVS
jgi:hypothetical protein